MRQGLTSIEKASISSQTVSLARYVPRSQLQQRRHRLYQPFGRGSRVQAQAPHRPSSSSSSTAQGPHSTAQGSSTPLTGRGCKIYEQPVQSESPPFSSSSSKANKGNASSSISNGSRIAAEIVVSATVHDVVSVLKDYDKLAEIVPNLASCRRMPDAPPGCVRLAQIGVSQSPLWRIEARCILDVWTEPRDPSGTTTIRFKLVDGDFERYSGAWIISNNPATSNSAYGLSTLLRYELEVVPKLRMPPLMLRQLIAAGLPANMQAVRNEAERRAKDAASAPGLSGYFLKDEEVDDVMGSGSTPTPDPGRSQKPWLSTFFTAWGLEPRRKDSNAPPVTYLGITDADLPPLPPAPRTRDAARRAAVRRTDRPDSTDEYIDLPSLASLDGDIALAESYVPPLPLAGKPLPYPSFEQPDLPELDTAALLKNLSSNNSARTSTSSTSSSSTSNTASSGAAGMSGSPSSAEVHLRRLDTDKVLHRRAVASILVDAPCQDVWAVLTNYESLPTVLPNVREAEVVRSGRVDMSSIGGSGSGSGSVAPRPAPSASQAPWRYIRLRQTVVKDVPYMRLRTEALMDVVEKPLREIQFRMVEGDFDVFQGKWIVEPIADTACSGSFADPDVTCVPDDAEARDPADAAGSDATAADAAADAADWPEPSFLPLPSPKGAHKTLLKLAVEVKLTGPEVARAAFLEPLIERLVYEDLPGNLEAIKARAERARYESLASAFEETGRSVGAQRWRLKAERSGRTVKTLADDLSLLEAELVRLVGPGRVMPSREELRARGRPDIERACRAHGGIAAVAEKLGWTREDRRSPKGFWHDIENVRREIDRFNAEMGRDPSVMPGPAELKRAGRSDLARAIKRWGGMAEVSSTLGLRVSSSKATSSSLATAVPGTGMRTTAADDLLNAERPLPRKKQTAQQTAAQGPADSNKRWNYLADLRSI